MVRLAGWEVGGSYVLISAGHEPRNGMARSSVTCMPSVSTVSCLESEIR